MLRHLWNSRTALLAHSIDYAPKSIKHRLIRLLDYPYDYPQLDLSLKCLMAYQYKTGYQGLISSDLQQARQQFQKTMTDLQYKSTQLASVQQLELQLSPTSSVLARHYHPKPYQSCPMIVFFHGGGFVLGNLDTHDEACRILAKYSGCQILSIDYPLAPEVTAQQIIETCEMAWDWVWQHQQHFNIPKHQIGIAGDSAGANLSTVVSQRRAQQNKPPIAQLLIYPTVDFKTRRPSFFAYQHGLLLTASDVDWITQQYAVQSQLALDDPLISPIYGQLNHSAAAFIVTAGHDLLHDEARQYAHRLKAVGVKVKYQCYPHQAHGFINLTSISKQSKQDLIEISQRFKQFLNTVI